MATNTDDAGGAPPRLEALLTACCGVCLALGFARVPYAAYIGSAFGAYFALGTAWESLRDRRVDVNLLMVLAAVGAIAIDRPMDAAVLLFLFSLSTTLESYAMARTRSAIQGLVKLRPRTARRVANGSVEEIPVESVRLGDLLRLAPFEAAPVDGLIVEGQSSFDQSAMTGESIPVGKAPGDAAIAGSQNLQGTVVIRATSVIGDSTLDQVIEFVRDAHQKKARTERISDWIGQRYTLGVIACSAIFFGVLLVRHVQGSAAFYHALTLLVALSPCALVISTPATTLSALAWAARNGILVRGGEFIELAGRIDTAVFDKTGTLTLGRPELIGASVWSLDGAPLGDRLDQPEVEAFIKDSASVELEAGHPLGEAVVRFASAHLRGLPEAADRRVVPGLGVTALIRGERALVGRDRLLSESGVALPEEVTQAAEAARSRGETVSLAAFGNRIGILRLSDTPRPGTEEALTALRAGGVSRMVLLSGDTPATVHAIASEFAIDEARGGLMPNDKAIAIGELAEGGATVMMVGDGVNDAPSLTRATVGVAMGGLGSDIALNSADVVLMNDSLGRLPDFLRLGKRCNRVILANMLFAASMILFLTVCSLLGRLALPYAVVGHEGSTVVVLLNGLRLLAGPGKAPARS
ncbi:MAG TPA: cation-translocating P-type ATPase [Fimbriimonadaceae bacterium]|nr:cation-translocating P-type ATPase [Fimbriimonadaceae bacterium]